MKTFNPQRILIPVDFSETSFIAIEHAAFTAQLFKAELILLHVVEKHWENFNVIAPEIVVEMPTDLVNSIEKRLQEVAVNIRTKYGVKSTCFTADGNIFTEIIAVAEEQNVDLIMMGTHGTSGIVEFFVGSNTYKVVTEASCPVISVRAHAEKLGYQNIVLTIDDTEHTNKKENNTIIIPKKFS